ncbi:hypothetical protein JCM5350_003433 [Sporobolomyces pararoseus]
MSHPLAKRSDSSLPTPPRSPTGIRPKDPLDVGDVEALKGSSNVSASASPNLGGAGGGPFSPMTPSDGLSATNYFPAITPVHSNDPLLLATRLQTEEHISELRKRKNGNKTGAFYSKQNAHITSLLKSMDQHILEAEEEEDSNRLALKIAIYGSLVCNCILAILQIYAAVSSLSLSFFATAADAIFDPAANLVLNYCHRKAQKVDLVKFPSGGSKFETIGDITYSGVMGAVSVILVAFSIQELARGDQHDKELHIPAAVVVGISFLVKLALFIYCFSLRSKNSQVRVLWEDHRNDLFINGFGLFTACAGAKIAWFIDPLGALIISFILIFVWGNTIRNHFYYLAGAAAPLEFQQLVIYKAMTFAEQIEAIDTCVVYHNGPRYVVEVDLVMHGETPLRVAHDVSQALQDKLEELPQVDRAFVHVDHETSHSPEHRKVR